MTCFYRVYVDIYFDGGKEVIAENLYFSTFKIARKLNHFHTFKINLFLNDFNTNIHTLQLLESVHQNEEMVSRN